MMTEEKIIYSELRDNSIVFLKDFINKLPSKNEYSVRHMPKEFVILSVSSLQISMELALKAVVVKKSGLIHLINGSSSGKSIPQLFTEFEKNKLKTKSFEEIKVFTKQNNLIGKMSDFDYNIITEFQKYRNGIIHFSFKFQEGDYLDLKYDITYFVVSILIKALCSGDDDIKPSEFLASLGLSYHKKLTDYPPYIKAMQEMAARHSTKVFFCIVCCNKTYAQDEQYCYCCNLYGNLHSFRNCEHCGEVNSMIYDGLNLENNSNETRGYCLSCQKDALIFVCPTCGISYNLETNEHSKICSIGNCLVSTS